MNKAEWFFANVSCLILRNEIFLIIQSKLYAVDEGESRSRLMAM